MDLEYCPINSDSCEDCNKNWDGRCGHFFPSVLLKEVLTPHERIDLIEARLDKIDGAKIPRIQVKHITVYEPKKKEEGYTVG